MAANNVVAHLAGMFPNGTAINLTPRERQIAESLITVLHALDVEEYNAYLMGRMHISPGNGQNGNLNRMNGTPMTSQMANNRQNIPALLNANDWHAPRIPPMPLMQYPTHFQPSTSNFDFQLGWMYPPTVQNHHPFPNQMGVQDFNWTTDNTAGRNYGNEVNFNDQRGRGVPNPKPNRTPNQRLAKPLQPLALPKVKALISGMITLDLKINPAALICFAGKDNFLSNMYPAPIEIDGHRYSSVEHYYQCTKVWLLVGSEKATELINVKDGNEAKKMAHKLVKSVEKSRIEAWKIKDAPKILDVAIRRKFEQNVELKKKLLDTKDAILAHTFDKENIYATGCREDELCVWTVAHKNEIYKIPVPCTDPKSIDCIPLLGGKGRNLQGAITMVIRKDLAIAESLIQQSTN